ncbi:MAG: hypothetical protein WC777_04160 [Candidatus Gracilibacteria bacterium]|jgi:hypothetical protein
MIDTNELLNTIKSKGYWKVLVRPNKFESNLISSLDVAKKVIDENKVDLRGWDYPHVDRDTSAASEDSIHSKCSSERGSEYEYWRYFLSGQFVHYFGTREDWLIEEEDAEAIRQRFHFGVEEGTEPYRFLDVLSTLYRLNEIFLFTSRLAQAGYLGDSLHLEIELIGVKDRTLFFWSRDRHLRSIYTCDFPSDKITFIHDITKADIISDHARFALEDALKLFSSFNWRTASKEVFQEDQKKFLERRLS